MTSLLISRGNTDTPEEVRGTNGADQTILLYGVASLDSTQASFFCRKRGKKCFRASRVGGLERFEMPHVALILRVETDSITASFRNLLYFVSQSQGDFP